MMSLTFLCQAGRTGPDTGTKQFRSYGSAGEDDGLTPARGDLEGNHI